MRDAQILVVLPTLGNRLDTLEQTLASIELQRSEVSLTLVVVTPNSATEARQLAERYESVLVDDPGVGISEAINSGLRARDGEEFYAWIGDDDLFLPSGLSRLHQILMSSPKAVLAFGGCHYIDHAGTTLAISNAGRLAISLLPWGPNLIPHPGTMVRLDALEAIGGFDPKLTYAMDLDAFLSLRKYGKFAFTRRSVSAFRWHAESLTVSNRRQSSLESERVKRSHLPIFLRPVSYVWSYPIRWASAFAASRVSARARARKT